MAKIIDFINFKLAKINNRHTALKSKKANHLNAVKQSLLKPNI